MVDLMRLVHERWGFHPLSRRLRHQRLCRLVCCYRRLWLFRRFFCSFVLLFFSFVLLFLVLSLDLVQGLMVELEALVFELRRLFPA